MREIALLTLLITGCLPSYHAKADEGFRSTVERQNALASRSGDWLEGYGNYLRGELIDYSSHLDECRQAFLCRTTDGRMEIEWETREIPEDHSGTAASFLVVAGFDRKEEAHVFDIFVNDVPRFSFSSTEKKDWVVSGEEGGSLEFISFLIDQHGDGQGYLILNLPVEWVGAGNAARIKVRGRAESAQTWFMVYRCKEALSRLHSRAAREFWLDLNIEGNGPGSKITAGGPASLIGKTLRIGISNFPAVKLSMKKQGTGSAGAGKLRRSIVAQQGSDLILELTGFPPHQISGLYEDRIQTRLLQEVLVRAEGISQPPSGWRLSLEQRYQEDLHRNLQLLSSGDKNPGSIHLMSSSHQDIAWMDSPEQCRIDRDLLLITPTLALMEEQADYRHDMEHVLMLREYLETHPGSYDRIYKLSVQGRLAWGATYNEPYEEMYGGEALIRQLYLGKRWIEGLFPGVRTNVYWNPDVPGRSLQMPQILSRSGVKYMMISRHAEGIFHWGSPDGSSIITYSSSHYGLSRVALRKGLLSGLDHLAAQAVSWRDGISTGAANAFPVLSTEDMSPPVDYSELISTWNGFNSTSFETNSSSTLNLPPARYSTAEEFLDDYMSSDPDLPQITGERPNVWAYIHGPSHQRALAAGRAAGVLLPAAEKFASIQALLEKNWDVYPVRLFDEAWEAAIYPDHGWGGKNGDVTDSTFEAAFRKGRAMALQIIDSSLAAVSRHISASDQPGQPVHVFNSLSWVRSDPVELKIKKDLLHGDRGIRLVDERGVPVPAQYVRSGPGGQLSADEISLVFVASDVPPIGYRTYYLQFAGADPGLELVEEQITEIENIYYKLRLGRGGIESLFDKQLSVEVFDTERFLGGELFTMRSVGNGAGEFADVQQPDMTGFQKVSEVTGPWRLLEQGPVRTVITADAVMEHNRVSQRLIIYHAIRRIDHEVDLLDWDGTLYREFRLAYPLAFDRARVAYEVPFGTVRVGTDEIPGAAGERYVRTCSEVSPRGIDQWIGASGANCGFTLASGVAVADYMDPTDPLNRNTIIQPILLASRHSCHWEGLPYAQEGDHHFRFSLTTHLPGWENGYHFGRQLNEPLFPVFGHRNVQPAPLPAHMSFFSVDRPNLIISTIKKAEDDGALILRVYEAEGAGAEAVVNTFMPVSGVYETDMIERDPDRIAHGRKSFNVEIGHNAIRTFMLKTVENTQPDKTHE